LPLPLKSFDLVVTTLFGLEEILAEELRDLGVKEVQILNRAVRCAGDQALMYKCNLWLRTALKVLKPIKVFQARDEKQLYREIKSIDWQDFISDDQTFAIDCRTHGLVFTHSRYAALKSKDAIVDQLRDKRGTRPSINVKSPDTLINLHIADTRCTVSLDSSSDPLSKRGYRLDRTSAPINEVLAAGILSLTGWDKKASLWDPMCGSGTIPIEAALMAQEIPPGKNRSFGFEKWKDHDKMLWDQLKTDAKKKNRNIGPAIHGSDVTPAAVRIARQNAQRAGVINSIKFEKANFFETDPKTENGLIVMNPPYGERIKEGAGLVPLYQNIGTRLKHHYNGFDAWIMSGSLEALKFVGLKPSRKVKLFNGALECRLNKYELYQGSRKKRV